MKALQHFKHRGSSAPIVRLARTFWRDERGQSTTEYILILSVVVMIAMKFKKMFNQQMQSAMDTLNGELSSGMSDN